MRETIAGPRADRGVRWAAAGVFLTLALGCSHSGPTGPTQSTTRQPDGFTITEELSVGLGVRSDLEEAIQALEDESWTEGIELLVAITEREPELALAHLDLGIAYQRTDRLERAEASLERALELSPGHPAVLNELAIVLRRSGRFDEARKAYEAALDRFPDFHFARRNLAILCDLFLRDMACAVTHYRRYLETAPDDDRAAIWLADLENRLEE